MKKKKRNVSALVAASFGRSAVGAVRHHTHEGFDKTGTNVSYEGATAPGAGGSVGTGYASGTPAIDVTLRTNSDYGPNEAAHALAAKKEREEENTADEDFSGEF
jgi:hypothetical protein